MRKSLWKGQSTQVAHGATFINKLTQTVLVKNQLLLQDSNKL